MAFAIPVLGNDDADSMMTISQSRRAAIAGDLSSLDVGEVRFDQHDRLLYATDASLYQVEPIGVVLPRNGEGLRRALRYCGEHAVAVLPRGGGTSLAGQGVNHAVIFDLSPNFRRVVDIDAPGQICHVEPGVTIDELNRTLAERGTGLFFAVDPASAAQASIGGCIGNNAAGARSVRYGRTSENLAGLQVVLSTGQETWLEPGAGRRDAAALRLAEQVLVIVRRYADEIRRKFPKLVRRNAGYGLDLILSQLDRGVGPEDLDLSGLICGSEGTLAVVVEAKLKLHPTPAARGLAIAAFESVDAAIESVPAILASGASAVELLDDVVLDAARNNTECRPYADLIPKVRGAGANAALYVEYQANQPSPYPSPGVPGEGNMDQLNSRFDALRAILPNSAIAVYRDSGAMLKAWTLRKSGEALLHNVSGTRKPVTFVEDNSIPVENLARFVKGFRRIVAEHGTSAAYYAHASVGVLHVRPMLDLHEPKDLQSMRQIAIEVAELARDCGGVMSGEHGDGRARGPLLETFYGPQLIEAFAEIKKVFDPAGILNPGIIVQAGAPESITENLRVQAQTGDFKTGEIQTYFDYSDQDGLGGAVERCNGAGFCRKTFGGTMCPSYRATLDERHSTRGRGNALRLAITGQAPAWDDPDTLQTLDLCLSCKACKTECPSSVDVAKLKAEYTAQRYKLNGTVPLRARVFGHIRAMNRLGSLAPGLFNALAGWGPTRGAANRLLGLSPRRSLPRFQRSLYRWLRRRDRAAGAGRPRVVLFADCFSAYTEPEVGRAAVEALESLGYAVDLPHVGCCGRAMISTGLLADAIRTADRTLGDLREYILDERVKAVLVCEPSCLSAIKDDWLQLRLSAGMDLRRRLAGKAVMVEDFIDRFWDEHPEKPSLPVAGGPAILLHGHCHQKALWGDQTSAALLRRLAGERLTVLPSGCCGMAGSFGFTAEHYDLSMQIGELSVFGPVRQAPPPTIVLAPGTSCRQQIRDGAGRTALHPIQWVAGILRSNSTLSKA
jgi:FAD/FMN-containing dehydrogenase/Fe-S oxidoreductase